MCMKLHNFCQDYTGKNNSSDTLCHGLSEGKMKNVVREADIWYHEARNIEQDRNDTTRDQGRRATRSVSKKRNRKVQMVCTKGMTRRSIRDRPMPGHALLKAYSRI